MPTATVACRRITSYNVCYTKLLRAAWAYSIAVTLWRVRALILERERHTEWVGEILDAQEGRA